MRCGLPRPILNCWRRSMAKSVPQVKPVLSELLSYHPESGVLLWKKGFHSRLVGTVAGSPGRGGYIRVTIKGVKYPAHRLAWELYYGESPAGYIDHIDCNGSNNRISNLRIATGSQNGANRRRHRTNKSGFKGVCFHKRDRKWQASIKMHGKSHLLGLFASPEIPHESCKADGSTFFRSFARSNGVEIRPVERKKK